LYESFQWIWQFFQQWAAMVVEDRAMVGRTAVRKRIVVVVSWPIRLDIATVMKARGRKSQGRSMLDSCRWGEREAKTAARDIGFYKQEWEVEKWARIHSAR
jgi:hypothetical protein